MEGVLSGNGVSTYTLPFVKYMFTIRSECVYYNYNDMSSGQWYNYFGIYIGDVVLKPAWGKDQPNNYNGEQNCVVLDGGRNWLWNDVGCNLDYLHYVCQHSECQQKTKSCIIRSLCYSYSR